MPGDTERAQLLLIAGIGLAVTFVALAVVLNAAIFTGTLATQGSGVSGSDPLAYEQSVEHGLSGVVFHANQNYSGQDELVRNVRSWTGTWTRNASAHSTSRRVATDVSISAVHNGSWIFQAQSDAFTDTDGTLNWTLGSDVRGTRRFTMNVSRDSLLDEDPFPDVAQLQDSDPFRVEVSNGSTTYQVAVYRDDDDIIVQTAFDGDIQDRCHVTQSHAVIDVTEGTLAGDPCDALSFPRVEGTYSIEFVRGDRAAGRYALVVNRTRGNLTDVPYSAVTSADPPHAVPAVYALTVTASYQAAEVGYTTTRTFAPEAAPQQNPTFGVDGVPVVTDARELVFVNQSNWLKTVNVSGTVQTYDASDVAAIGPKSVDFDDDNRTEIPYVDDGTLRLIDDQNETQVLADRVRHSNTLLGVGAWGNATFARRTAVYYVNSSDRDIWRAWLDDSGTVQRQELRQKDGDGDGIKAIAGIADYNGDGDTDIVFTDGSALVTYIDGGTTHETPEGVGSNNGIGVGEPRDFDGDGSRRAPIVDGSNNVALLPHSSTSEDLTSSGPATKSPVAGIDWAGDSALEVAFIDASSDTLHYVHQNGTIVQLTDAGGDPIAANDDQGVA